MYFSENQEIISGLSTAYNKSYLSYLDLASLNYSKKWNLFLSIFVVPNQCLAYNSTQYEKLN